MPENVNLVPKDLIEGIVGATRHPQEHLGRVVSSEDRVYILHSHSCLDSEIDLDECRFSKAFITPEHWEGFLDVPVVLEVWEGWLRPTSLVTPEKNQGRPLEGWASRVIEHMSLKGWEYVETPGLLRFTRDGRRVDIFKWSNASEKHLVVRTDLASHFEIPYVFDDQLPWKALDSLVDGVEKEQKKTVKTWSRPRAYCPLCGRSVSITTNKLGERFFRPHVSRPGTPCPRRFVQRGVQVHWQTEE